MRIDWSMLALQLINFAILVWLLQHFLYKPVLRVIDARRQAADTRYAEAQRSAEAARQQLSGLEAQRAGVAADRAGALAEAREQGRQLIEARRAEAEREETLLAEARCTALDMAAEMARRVLVEIPESLRMQGWLERIEQHLRALPAAERAELEGELAAGLPLQVVSACSIPPALEERWRARLREVLGPDAAITFEANTELIGGAELHFPHATLGFSVARAIGALRKEAARHGEPH